MSSFTQSRLDRCPRLPEQSVCFIINLVNSILKNAALLGILVFILPTLNACRKPADRDFTRHVLAERVSLEYERNGVIVPRSLSFGYESDFHPALVQLRQQEQLEQVVSAGGTEFDKQRLLNDWVNSQWSAGKPVPYPPWDALVILDRIRSGRSKGFCAQYAVVLVQGCLSMGWQARYLAIAEELKPHKGHLTVEVWSNQYNKWVVLDPYYCLHYESGGEPLSGLELHRLLSDGRGSDVVAVWGSGLNQRRDIQTGYMISQYHHLALDLRNDHLSGPLHFWNRHQGYLSWQDRDTQGRENIFTRFTREPLDFDFPLNQVELSARPGAGPGKMRLRLRTNMPDAQTFLIRRDGGQWKQAKPPYFQNQPGKIKIATELDLLYGSVAVYHFSLEPGLNTVEVCALSRNGIRGPASELRLLYRPVN